MMLLGEVRELEVEAECAEDELLLAGAEAALDAGDRAFAPRGTRLTADPLHQLEEPRPFLLDEDRAEDRPEAAYVSAQGSGGIVDLYPSMPSAART